MKVAVMANRASSTTENKKSAARRKMAFGCCILRSGGAECELRFPLANGRLATHFGHCREFQLFEIDDDRQITASQRIVPPEHAPGILPRWLHAQGVNVVICGGRGQRAQTLPREVGIEVAAGAPDDAPDILVRKYLTGSLTAGDNLCDH